MKGLEVALDLHLDEFVKVSERLPQSAASEKQRNCI